jgi:ABC-type phosphate/phosphonate transport system substrate-binding protein
MYAVTAAVAAAWRVLFETLAREAGVALEVIEHPVPAPLAALWSRPDMASVFMCGLPFAQSTTALELIAAPVPAPLEFGGLPRYFSELLVRRDSGIERLEQTFGMRLALTAEGSQSGHAAALEYLRIYGGRAPLYREVIEPQVTPRGALTALLNGRAEVAVVDAYALALFQRHEPELAAPLRSVARTAATPIPVLVANVAAAQPLRAAFLGAQRHAALRPYLDTLLLAGFAAPDPVQYQTLARDYQAARQYWREHPLASQVHPAFV